MPEGKLDLQLSLSFANLIDRAERQPNEHLSISFFAQFNYTVPPT